MLHEQLQELEIKIFGIEKFNCRKEMTEMQRLESNIIETSNVSYENKVYANYMQK